MRKLLPVILLVGLAVPVIGQLRASGPDNSLKVGEMAPDFPIAPPPGQRGAQASSLMELAKTKNVLIMFFPAAFSPGCTTEFTQAGVHYDKFTALNVEMIGISRDGIWSLEEFKKKVGAKNTFVSDLEYSIIPKYGASNPNRGALRYYYLIDNTGKIIWKDSSGGLLDTQKLATDLATVLKK
jgi:peroxiredoxin Q/BCP